jgi:CCR4-NOT transcriptional regulation complex NOT5 subunit
MILLPMVFMSIQDIHTTTKNKTKTPKFDLMRLFYLIFYEISEKGDIYIACLQTKLQNYFFNDKNTRKCYMIKMKMKNTIQK